MITRNLPISYEKFIYALELGEAAAIGNMPIENIENKGLIIVDEDSGENLDIKFCDNPMTRFLLAIAKEFDIALNGSKYFSITNRIFILFATIIPDERSKPYRKESEDKEQGLIKDVLLAVIARFPITEDCGIDIEAFFDEVEKQDKLVKKI